LFRLAAATARRKDRSRGVIRAEVLGTLDRQQVGEARARAIDAALDRADRAFADRGRLLVGEAGGADQDQRPR
jgi:hypothetical protein